MTAPHSRPRSATTSEPSESEVDAHIRRLTQESCDSLPGQFSLALPRVQRSLAAGLPRDGLDFLQYWLRAARNLQIPRASVQWTAAGLLRFSWSGSFPSREAWEQPLMDPSEGPALLMLGLVCALHQGFAQLECRTSAGNSLWTAAGVEWRWQDRLLWPGCELLARGRRPPRAAPSFDLPVELDWNGRTLSPPRKCSGAESLSGELSPGQLHWWVDGWRLDSPPELQAPTRSRLDIEIQPEQRPQVKMDLLRRRLLRPDEAARLRWQEWIWQHLSAYSPWSSDWLEWAKVRSLPLPAGARWRAPDPGDPYEAAFYERSGEGVPDTRRRQAWERWTPETCWKVLWQTGNVPAPPERWLQPALAGFRGPLARACYRYLIRRQLQGPHHDAEFLYQLGSSRRDSLAVNYLMAGQMLCLGRWSRGPQAEFCLEYLSAACRGQEAREQVANLSHDERAELGQVTRLLAQLRSS